MVDRCGGVTPANAAAGARFGITTEEQLRSDRAIDVYAPSARAKCVEQAMPTATRHGAWRGELDIVLPDGSEVPVSQVLVAHRRPDGSIDYYSSIMRDISERRILEEQLAAAGLFDPTTGLPNRAVLIEAL